MSPDIDDDDDTPRSLAIAEAIGAWIGTLSGHGADFRMDPIVKKALEACAGTAWDRAAEHLAAAEQDRDRLRAELAEARAACRDLASELKDRTAELEQARQLAAQQ